MNKAEVVAHYRKNSPLRSNHPTFIDHVHRLKEHRDPSTEYDRVILLAREQHGRDVADKVWKSIKRPDAFTASQWRTRKPTLRDVDALVIKADRWLDPITEDPLYQESRIKASKGELTKTEYYHLATVLFGDPSTARWCRDLGRAEHGVEGNANSPSETPYFLDQKTPEVGGSGTTLPERSISCILEEVN